MPRRLKPHGTLAAYQRHVKAGEPACEACLAARAAYSRDYRAGLVSAREPAVCGTLRGYYAHRNGGKRACQPCLDEYATYTRQRRARLRAERAEYAAQLDAAWAEVLAESGVA